MLGNGVPSLLQHVRRLAATASSDEQLLADFILRRSDEAFSALLGRHGPMVFNVCRRILHDAHAAEDVFQATFLVLADRAGAIHRPGRWRVSCTARPTALPYVLDGAECRTCLPRRATEPWILLTSWPGKKFSAFWTKNWASCRTTATAPLWCFATWKDGPRTRRPASSAGASTRCAGALRRAGDCSKRVFAAEALRCRRSWQVCSVGVPWPYPVTFGRQRWPRPAHGWPPAPRFSPRQEEE